MEIMTSKYSSCGVDVVLESLDNADSPHCPHGPTLLFERYFKGSVKHFYACSACRDRKSCSFFQWANESLSKEKLNERHNQMIQLQKAAFSQEEYKKSSSVAITCSTITSSVDKSPSRLTRKFLHEDDGTSSSHGNTLIIMDPPFGGMVNVLSRTVGRIQKDWKEVNPGKVTYDNHKVFTGNKKFNKHGSPVRIFTNLPSSDVILPTSGYRFCKQCTRYVSLENKHCEQCNDCTSKDGRQYVHCTLCKRCVKPSWSHCGRCDKCHIPGYKCQAPNMAVYKTI
ncbi:hypothetical protein LSH36_74g11013 [Paralvinella palmiformis]|uniref:GRF-type domain-containing protein n=1 Tax=Paralvinella palmiformis TaxID=53620 RepID=A0AAD9K4I2_9ANNE|nr:hypothetical protein LSH36_74g11013 [Paralvinella palmiformis]